MELDQKVVPAELDISAAIDYESLFEGVGVVVMCRDQDSAEIARQCLNRGIHYVDISASYPVLSKIEALRETARESGATAVLSVGLAPGLTNLLAKHCQSKVPEMTAADIYVLLGLGEAHGEAAIRWTLENLDTTYSVLENGKTKQVKSFQDSKKTVFPDGTGRRTTYRFNFSDQHVIPYTLGLQGSSTRLCFDSALVTSLLALMKKTKLSRIFTIKKVERFVTGLLKRMNIGSDEFVIKVEGSGFRRNEALYECSLKGNGEGRVTGLVAASIVEKLVDFAYPSGVFHIEQLFNLSEFLKNPDNYGLVFEERKNPPLQVTETHPKP